jgi:hypothetical protein
VFGRTLDGLHPTTFSDRSRQKYRVTFGGRKKEEPDLSGPS